MPRTPKHESSREPVPAAAPRVHAIDALRGFDMFWIVGGDALAVSLLGLLPAAWARQLRDQFEHVAWEGFRFYDLIFPLFLFLVGCVLPYSLDRWRGEPAAAYLRIARRTLALLLLGLIYNGLLQFQWSELRLAGVLQRIAVCYAAAALVYLHLRVRGQVLLMAAILLGYWAMLRWVPPPGGSAGDLSPAGNLAGYLDRSLLPGKILPEYYGYGDNEGLLSTLPAVATAILGLLAGAWLKQPLSAWKKASGLLVAGVAALFLGQLWSQSFPVIKNLWTSSFVLVAGGYSLLLLGLFYWLIDGLGWRRWAFFWTVIGANAITIYIGKEAIDFEHTARYLCGGLIQRLLAQGATDWANAVLWTAILAAQWIFLWFLYRHKIFLRV
jgi:predicted acyltransferase